jgi:hypothetical protein
MNAQKEGAWVYGLEFTLAIANQQQQGEIHISYTQEQHSSIQTNEHQECSFSWLMVISSDSLGRLTRSFFNDILFARSKNRP